MCQVHSKLKRVAETTKTWHYIQPDFFLKVPERLLAPKVSRGPSPNAHSG